MRRAAATALVGAMVMAGGIGCGAPRGGFSPVRDVCASALPIAEDAVNSHGHLVYVQRITSKQLGELFPELAQRYRKRHPSPSPTPSAARLASPRHGVSASVSPKRTVTAMSASPRRTVSPTGPAFVPSPTATKSPAVKEPTICLVVYRGPYNVAEIPNTTGFGKYALVAVRTHKPEVLGILLSDTLPSGVKPK